MNELRGNIFNFLLNFLAVMLGCMGVVQTQLVYECAVWQKNAGLLGPSYVHSLWESVSACSKCLYNIRKKILELEPREESCRFFKLCYSKTLIF